MSEAARPKYSSTAPAGFSSSLPENPRKDYDDPSARPSGRSGGGECPTPHRNSSSVRKGERGAKKRSRRRG